jgi:predicted kinase
MPILTVLVGLPGSGKSTSILEDFDGFVYSTDNYIEEKAAAVGKTYSEAFHDFIGPATKSMNDQLAVAIQQRSDIIWDQTNLAPKKRRGILKQIPGDYTKICVCRMPPRNEEEMKEIKTRLANRPGKDIPEHVIENMLRSFVKPSRDEGFDMIHFYDIYGNFL